MSMHTVEVETFGRHGKFAVKLTHPSTALQLKEAAGQRLKLQPASLQLFGVFLGPLGNPTQVLLDHDVTPMGGTMSLQRWNFDVEREAKLFRQDDVTIHLLHSEAKFKLEQGRLQPTEAQLMELEGYSDPKFPTERQFLECAQTVPGYTAFCADGCKTLEDIECNDGSIPSGSYLSSLSCTVDNSGLTLRGAGDVKLEWPWTQIRRWTTPGSNTVKFDVCLKQQNAPIMKWISLATPQACFLAITATTICDYLKAKQDAADQPFFRVPRPAEKPSRSWSEMLVNSIFKMPEFSSILSTDS